MLTKEEINAIRQEMEQIDDDIHTLEQEKSRLKQKLITNTFEIVDAKFPGLNFGDKVKVTREIRDFFDHELLQTVTETLYFHSRTVGAYMDGTNTNQIKYEFFQCKKDGSRSKKTVQYWYMNITAIEKVTE